ncbi:NAD(P)-binding protein [Rhizodiscina lignyota]|uniref:NAD(P)-binding protein n=1 Tax=Rhizodiscina lignyota TaxID=1504668 RepID=A0A9P4M6X2_9PEZI|nr:NAD(P)-binding protein [Rhizodiscina lignyota]
MDRGALIVIGSGPGIGRSVASAFASNGFTRIFLIRRNAQGLEDDKATVIATAGKDIRVDTIVADISDQQALAKALQQIEEEKYVIECVFFNAARVEPSEMLKFPIEEIEHDFRTTNIALYQTAQWAIPLLKVAKGTVSKPSLLVTNSLLYKYPVPQMFSLTFTKAAQRTLVEMMTTLYAPEGIHVGLISVGGPVAPENKVLNPKNIAKETWHFFQNSMNGDLEIEIVER